MSSTASPHPTRCHVVIPCAGSGSRAGGNGPKQYQSLAGQPMAMHTLRAFAAVAPLSRVLLVTAAGDAQMPALLQDLNDPRFEAAPIGGATRADSVLAGLLHLARSGAGEDDWVLVHDAARCLVTAAQIEALIQTCADDSVGGLLALPLSDTLKSADAGRAVATLPRDDKWLAQTPQMFRLGALREALLAAQSLGFAGITDEASAMERAGHSVRLVMGSPHNFKLTYAHDFDLAEAVLQARRHPT